MNLALKPISRFPNYLVSYNGDVFKRKDSELIPISKSNHNRGYLFVNIRSEGKQFQFLVHRIVAKEFIENPNGFNEVNHIDGNKKNNHISNLEWCSHLFNVRHSIEIGTFKISKKNKK